MPRRPFWELKQDTAEERLAKQEARVAKAAQITQVIERAPSSVKLPKEVQPSVAPKSYSDLLSVLYTQFQSLSDEIASADLPVDKKAEALSKLARTLPLLRAAQDASVTKVNKKELKELSDAELRALVAKELK